MTLHDELAEVLSIIDKWMESYDHMGTGGVESMRQSEQEWARDRVTISQTLAACQRENQLLRENVQTLDDYHSHHIDWRAACVIARDVAANSDDASYWQHQINTLDRIGTHRYTAAALTNDAEAKP